MSDHDFQLKVMEALGELKTDMSAVKEHLKTLNGKVLSHEKELSERRGAERATKHWVAHVVPVLRYIAGILISAIAILSMNHAKLFPFVR